MLRVISNYQNQEIGHHVNNYLNKKIKLYNEKIASLKKLLFDKSDIMVGVFSHKGVLYNGHSAHAAASCQLPRENAENEA